MVHSIFVTAWSWFKRFFETLDDFPGEVKNVFNDRELTEEEQDWFKAALQKS